jgi:hypothetical protein
LQLAAAAAGVVGAEDVVHEAPPGFGQAAAIAAASPGG